MLDFTTKTSDAQEYQHVNLTGKILVASPIMDDDYFKRTVVYICAHDEENAIGVMVNRTIGEIDLKAASGDDEHSNYRFPLHNGGPVSPDKLVILTVKKNYYRRFNTNPVVTIYTELNDFYRLYVQGKLSKKFMIAQGITAWESSQLAEEVGQNFWLVADSTRETLFGASEKTWQKELKKVGLTPDSKYIVNYTGNA